MERQYKQMFYNSRRNAETRGIKFILTAKDMEDLCRRADGKCMVTGIPFSLEAVNTDTVRKPWAPSLDRISSLGPYSRENTRLVCQAVNIGMNEWGEDVLRHIATAINSKDNYSEILMAITEGIKQSVVEAVLSALRAELPAMIKQPTQSSIAIKSTRQLLRKREVMVKTGLSSTSVWRYEQAGNFPPRKKLSNGAIRYDADEVDNWIATRQYA